MINISNVSFSYGKNDILNDISLTIRPRSLMALIGLNGAGKSTLIGCLSKQNKINQGRIIVNGKDISDYSFNEYAKIVSVVPQLSSIKQADCKVRDFMVQGRTPHLNPFAIPGVDDYRESEKIAIRMRVDHFLDMEFTKLSGGQQQLVLLARALVQDTPIILLDEPMSALDLKNQSFFMKCIKQLHIEGKTIIFSTHNPNHALALSCDVCVLHNKQIICHGRADEVLTPTLVQEIYGSDVYIYEHSGRKHCEIAEL